MFRRRRDRQETPGDPSPVVFDRQGIPVGVRTAPPQGTAEETPQSARASRREALRKTRELDAAYQFLLPVSLFYRDPPH